MLSASSVYDTSGAASDRNSVVLNDIHIDIMDYIVPASCTDTEFRQMWAEFEWENKVAVNTNISDLHEYLDHIIRCTNMKCLTPEKVGWLAPALSYHNVELLLYFFLVLPLHQYWVAWWCSGRASDLCVIPLWQY